jgi:hypothetical protein
VVGILLPRADADPSAVANASATRH